MTETENIAAVDAFTINSGTSALDQPAPIAALLPVDEEQTNSHQKRNVLRRSNNKASKFSVSTRIKPPIILYPSGSSPRNVLASTTPGGVLREDYSKSRPDLDEPKESIGSVLPPAVKSLAGSVGKVHSDTGAPLVESTGNVKVQGTEKDIIESHSHTPFSSVVNHDEGDISVSRNNEINKYDRHKESYPQPLPEANNHVISDKLESSRENKLKQQHQAGIYPRPWSRNGRYVNSPTSTERIDGDQHIHRLTQSNVGLDENYFLDTDDSSPYHSNKMKDSKIKAVTKESLLKLSAGYQLKLRNAQINRKQASSQVPENGHNRDSRWMDMSHQQLFDLETTANAGVKNGYYFNTPSKDFHGNRGLFPISMNRSKSDDYFNKEKEDVYHVWSPSSDQVYTRRKEVQYVIHDPVSDTLKPFQNSKLLYPFKGGKTSQLTVRSISKKTNKKIEKISAKSTQTDINEATQTDISDIQSEVSRSTQTRYHADEINRIKKDETKKTGRNSRNFSQQWPAESEDEGHVTGLGLGESGQFVMYLRSQVGLTLGPFLFEVEAEGVGLPRPATPSSGKP